MRYSTYGVRLMSDSPLEKMELYVIVQELPYRSLLLFSQLFRETAHHLLDYVDFGS